MASYRPILCLWGGFPFWFFFPFLFTWLLAEVKSQWRDCLFSVTERLLFKEMDLMWLTGPEIWQSVCVALCEQNVWECAYAQVIQCSIAGLTWIFLHNGSHVVERFLYGLCPFVVSETLYRHLYGCGWRCMQLSCTAHFWLKGCVCVCVSVLQVVKVVEVISDLWSGEHSTRTPLPCHSTQPPCRQHAEPHPIINCS